MKPAARWWFSRGVRSCDVGCWSRVVGSVNSPDGSRVKGSIHSLQLGQFLMSVTVLMALLCFRPKCLLLQNITFHNQPSHRKRIVNGTKHHSFNLCLNLDRCMLNQISTNIKTHCKPESGHLDQCVGTQSNFLT